MLIKSAEALETFEKVDTLVVDKTGTLTEGRPKLVSVVPAEGISDQELLSIAGGLERGSEHPLAAAILDGLKERGVEALTVAHFDSVTGKGVRGTVENVHVGLGNPALMSEFGIDTSSVSEQADKLRSEGQTVMFLGRGTNLLGMIGVADPIKESSAGAIKALHDDGVRIVMLTGDNRKTAEAVARKLGIDDVRADVLPEGKIEAIKALQSEGRVVAMAGDGINDAPALAQAHVGVAMGSGTDVAMESAELTLLRGDLSGLVKARKLSRATMSNIRQNLFFAFVYNAAGVPIAAGVLYPFTGLLLSPMIAALAMSLSSVSVIGNALRLRNTTI